MTTLADDLLAGEELRRIVVSVARAVADRTLTKLAADTVPLREAAQIVASLASATRNMESTADPATEQTAAQKYLELMERLGGELERRKGIDPASSEEAT